MHLKLVDSFGWTHSFLPNSSWRFFPCDVYSTKVCYYIALCSSISLRTLGYGWTRSQSKGELMGMLMTACCANACLKKLSFQDLEDCVEAFSNKNQTEKRHWILIYLSEHTQSDTNEILFIVKGKTICKKAWLKVYGIRQERFRLITKDFKAGIMAHVHGNRGKKKPGPKATNTIAWMTFFVNALGDQQPDQVKVHLPSCFNQHLVYERMRNEMEEVGEDCVSLQHFYRLWKEHFPHVIIPKVNFFSHTIIICNIYDVPLGAFV